MHELDAHDAVGHLFDVRRPWFPVLALQITPSNWDVWTTAPTLAEEGSIKGTGNILRYWSIYWYRNCTCFVFRQTRWFTRRNWHGAVSPLYFLQQQLAWDTGGENEDFLKGDDPICNGIPLESNLWTVDMINDAKCRSTANNASVVQHLRDIVSTVEELV